MTGSPAMARRYFNPRSPCGERLPVLILGESGSGFQSTLPVWGATMQVERRSSKASISIHAPRVGSDTVIWSTERSLTDFNPRSPCGERLGDGIRIQRARVISIHAPRVGSDPEYKRDDKLLIISIHAPRVGSDLAS